MKALLFLSTATFLLCYNGYSKQNHNFNTYTELKVGDQMPDYTFINLINYPKKTVAASEFRGKLLILDFWSRGCTSCIASWPKLEQLQKQFGEKIKILLINTNDDEKTVRAILDRRKKTGAINLTLPTVCRDTMLLQLFPIKTVPHVVWIDENGKVISITYSETLTSRNISAVLNHNNFIFHQKKNHSNSSSKIDLLKPFVTQQNGYKPSDIIQQSSLTTYNDKVMSTLGCISSKDAGYSIFITNAPIVEMYKYAYGNEYLYDTYLQRLRPAQLRINFKNPEKYTAKNEDNETIYEYLYSYQLYSNVETSQKELQLLMRKDLNTFFGLSVKLETHNVKTLVLKDIDTTKFIHSKNREQFSSITDNEIILENLTFDDILHRLQNSDQYAYSQYMIINESKYHGATGLIKIDNITVRSNEKLDRALRKYGISFVLEDRPVLILTLSDQEKEYN